MQGAATKAYLLVRLGAVNVADGALHCISTTELRSYNERLRSIAS